MSARLEWLRRLCLALPETTEVEAWEDHPTFRLVEDLVRESYRLMAPTKLAALVAD